MNGAQSITTVNDAILEQMIADAGRRIVYMAPGISAPVAGALVEAAVRLAPSAVDVILDMDSDIYRLGYGTVEGLRVLEEAELAVCQQAGVRIGLLIADDATLVYAPVPQLVEAESNRPDRPNAIRLGPPPPALAEDVGLGSQPDRERAVGLDVVSPQQVSAVKTELERNPPARFDLARKVRVYSNLFQFVEISMPNCSISRRKVTLPPHLSVLGGDKSMADRIHTQFDLVTKDLAVTIGDDREASEKQLHSARDTIVKRYVKRIPKYGAVILHADKPAFDKAIKLLKADVEAFQQGLTDALRAEIDASAARMVEGLLPLVKATPPQHYRYFLDDGLGGEPLSEMLEQEIRQAIGTAGDYLDKMDVKALYKDVTVEMIESPEFLEAAHKAGVVPEDLHRKSHAVEAEAAP